MGDPPHSESKAIKPLSKYTSIDLENELPEIFSTSLNPNLRDPDLTVFYGSREPPFYSYKPTHSPPFSTYSNRKSCSTSPQQVRLVPIGIRPHFFLMLAITVFFIFPILILIVFRFPGIILFENSST